MPLEEVFPYTPKKVRHHSRIQHLKPFFGKTMRLARRKVKRKRIADYGASRSIKPKATEAGGEENREREKQQEGLEPGLGLFEGGRKEDEFRAKTKGRPG